MIFSFWNIYKCFTDGRLMLQAARGLSISCFLLLWYLARAHIDVPWLKIAILTTPQQNNWSELTWIEWILAIRIASTELFVELVVLRRYKRTLWYLKRTFWKWTLKWTACWANVGVWDQSWHTTQSRRSYLESIEQSCWTPILLTP